MANARATPAHSEPGTPPAGLRRAILRELAHHERLLLILWHAERMTPAEIALCLDMTEQQVARAHQGIIERLAAIALA